MLILDNILLNHLFVWSGLKQMLNSNSFTNQFIFKFNQEVLACWNKTETVVEVLWYNRKKNWQQFRKNSSADFQLNIVYQQELSINLVAELTIASLTTVMKLVVRWYKYGLGVGGRGGWGCGNACAAAAGNPGLSHPRLRSVAWCFRVNRRRKPINERVDLLEPWPLKVSAGLGYCPVTAVL